MDDAGTVRLSTSEDPDDPYILVRAGVAYIVGETEAGPRGAPLGDFARALRASGDAGKALASTFLAPAIAPGLKLAATRTGSETVAGVQGTSFVVRGANLPGSERFTVVLADDARLRPIGKAIATCLADLGPIAQLMPAGTHDHVGWLRSFAAILADGMPLRIDDDLVLVRFSANAAIAASRTALPATVPSAPAIAALLQERGADQ